MVMRPVPLRRSSLLAVAAAVALAAVPAARADERALAEARAAIKQVKYDRAQAILVEALRAGGHTPAELAEVLQLAGTTAIVLGQRDVGEQYFRQWLALAPDATLPAGVSPKLREAFVAAQAAMAALGRLEVRVRATGRGTLDVEVVRDPLRQVAAVATVTARGLGAARPLIGARLELTGADVTAVQVLDVHGNQLRVIDRAVFEPARSPGPTPEPSSAPSSAPSPDPSATAPSAPVHAPTATRPDRTAPARSSRRPTLRAWTTWAIPTAVTAGVGLGFTLYAQAARDERDRLFREPGGQFLEEYQVAVEAAEDRQLIGNLAFVATGVLAVTGAVLVLTWHPAPVSVAPRVDGDGGGVVLTATW
jgi:hypothetical protein